MAILTPTASRSGLGRILRAVAALLAGLLVTTCADNPTSPNRPGFGSVRIQPAFDQYAMFAPLVLNQVRVVVVRPPSDTVADTSRAFSVTQQQLTMSIPVIMQSTRETMQVTLQLLAGQTLLFSGTDDVEVRQGNSTPATSIPVTYSGPGSDATSIEIEPRDTIVQVGATVPFRATARDIEGVDVGLFYLGWSLVNAGPGATIDATGSLHAPANPGTLIVRGITPTGLRDSVTVTVVPVPAALAKTSGDNQTGSPGQRLAAPLAVLVTGTGQVPVPGVPVTFAVTTGGGTLDSTSVTTDAQGIARTTGTLGQTIGAQTFTASATGLTAVVFTATAQGVQPANHRIVAGRHTCELRNGNAFCWGVNGGGALGVDIAQVAYISIATPVQGGLTFTTLTAGEYHTCGLTPAGQAYCWGDNTFGQLGDGTNTNRAAPTPVSGGRTFVQIESNNIHTCALTATGEAFCWGWNERGELGDGTTTDRNAPVAVNGGFRFAKITTGVRSTCALDFAGAAFCWGENGAGELGDGTTTDRPAPTAVVGGQVFREINGSNNSFCAINPAGNGFCWGFIFNQIVPAPQAMGGGPYTSVSGGGDHVCALTAAGAAFCGGDNQGGQLGDGNAPTDSPTPVAVSGGLVFTELATGMFHSCGTTANGTYCWGSNAGGTVGNGAYVQQNTPARVIGPATSIAVNGGNNQTALPGAAVTTPPSVIVRDAQNAPLRGMAVTFAVTAGGGSIISASDTTDANGIAQVGSWTLGATVGVNTLTATASYPNFPGNPVSFTATAGAPPTFKTWTGAVSSDFSNAANWNGGAPGITDSAVIVATPNSPELSTETVIGALTITGGTLRVNGQGLSVVRNLTITGGGLIMDAEDDVVVVGGNATFNGLDTGDLLTTGTLTIGGNFTQLSTLSPFSFSPSGNHQTVFTTGTHTISFASPGSPSGSGFQELILPGNGTTTLATATWVRGTLTVGGTGQIISSSNGSRLGVALLQNVAPVTFNNVPLVINQTDQTSITNQPLTFQNMATNVVQLEINHPGSSSPLTLTGFVFSTTPVAPNGFYLDVNDNLANANPVVINMVGTSPASGAPFVRTSGGATVNWAAAGATLRVWNGSVNSDWTITNNWDEGVVPEPGDDVLIPEDAINDPFFGGLITLRNLSLESESGETELTVNGDGGINITGNLLAAGRVLGSGTIALVGAGPHQVSAELLSNLTVDGNTTVIGGLGIERSLQINSGTFDLRDVAITVGGAFRVVNAGTIQMNNGSFIDIAGDALFDGSSTAGLIAGGGINVGGNFTAGTADGSFSPGFGNSVSLTGSATQTVTLGSTASYFDNFGISKSDGSVILGSDITIFQTLGGGGSDIRGPGTVTAGDLNIANLRFDNVRLVWNALNPVPPFTFSNITFENYAAAPPQFTINHPGLPSTPIELDGLTFVGVPQTFHLLVNDNAVDGVPLVVNLTNPTPTDGTGLFSVTNGATVNWPAEQPTWTGAVSTDWNTAGNWSTNRIPGPFDRVTISPAANQPSLSSSVTVLSVSISGAATRLTVNGHVLTVNQSLFVNPGGLLVMTNPADRVNVNGDLGFAGIDPTGFLTAGEMRVVGSFFQSNNNFSFRPSGSHKVIMVGSVNQSISFCCGSGTSWFQNLDISEAVSLDFRLVGFGVFVNDTLISRPAAGHRPRLLGGQMQVARVNVNGMDFDRGRLTINEGGVAANQVFDNVDFVDYGGISTPLNMLTLTMAGGAPRTVTFNNLRFEVQGVGSTVRYLNVPGVAGTLVVNLPGATPASNGPALTTAGSGVTVNWPANDNVTWTGAVNGDWSTAGNWSNNLVPVASNDLIIPAGTPNAPTVGAVGVFARGLIVNTGAVVTIATGGQLIARGNLEIDGSVTGPGKFSLWTVNTGDLKQVRGNVRMLEAFASIDLTGTLRVTDSLIYGLPGTRLFLGGRALIVGGNLNTTNGARLSMNTAADSLDVGGNLTISGSQLPGDLVAGVIRLRGSSFTQTFDGSFVASGTHRVVMAGTAPQQIQFADPTTNSFNDLTIANTAGPVNILSPVYVQGVLRANSPLNELRNGDSVVVNGGTNITGLTLTGTLLRIITTTPATPITLNNVTFTGQAATATQLAVDHPGIAAGSLTFSNLVFQTTPTGAGRYLRASDNNVADGNGLVINLTTPTPAISGGFVTSIGGAVINWPTVPSASTWTGTASNAWANPANWSAGVPGSITAVTIPSGTPNAPTAGAVTGSSAGNLTVAAGATLTLTSPFNLTVYGNIDAQGTIGPISQGLTLAGSAQTLRGNVPQLTATGIVTLNGNTTASSNGPCVFNGTAELIVNGFTFSCFQLQFNNTARIQMTNAADSVVALGPAQFFGGSTAGRLTAGVLDLRGSFQQTGTNSVASFAATGTRVRASGTGASSYAMGTGGPGQSQFRTLLISRTGGTMTMSGSLVYITDSMVVSSAIPISIPGTLNPNKLRLAAGAGLTGAGSIQVTGDSLFVATPANYTIGNTLLYGTGIGDQKIPALPYPSLTLENSSTHTLTASTVTNGPVFIVNGILVLGGRTLSTAAGFQVQPDGQLRMNSANDSLLVGGNAFFQSTLDGTGNMTAGVLRVAQNMTVNGSTTGFQPSGTHKTILASVLTSNVNWTGLGTTPIQFQNLEANANNLSINYARVNGTMNVTGAGGINVSTLNVRGLLTTSAGSGMGVDSLYLGSATGIAPGSGYVAANVFVFDGSVLQTIPLIQNSPMNAKVIVRGNAQFSQLTSMADLRVEGSGRLSINGQPVSVLNDFVTADNGVLVMQNPADQFHIAGATTFGGGDEDQLLTEGILQTSGRFTQDGTNSIRSFLAVGNHITRMSSNGPGGNVVTFGTPQASAFMNLEVYVPVTFASNILIFNDFTNNAIGTSTAQRVAVQGDYIQAQAVTFTPRRFVYYGTLSTGINVTAGSFRPDTIQFNDGITTVPVNGNIVYGAAEATGFGEVRLGATAPAFTSLLINGTSQLQLNGRALSVLGPLTATGGSVLGTGTLQARRFQVSALTVDNARLILNENGTAQTQQLDNVTFQNLTSPGVNVPLLDVTGVGNGATRTLTFNNVSFPVVTATHLYTALTSSNAQNLNLVMAGSNRAAVGAASSNPPNETRVNGALIDWQSAGITGIWSGTYSAGGAMSAVLSESGGVITGQITDISCTYDVSGTSTGLNFSIPTWVQRAGPGCAGGPAPGITLSGSVSGAVASGNGDTSGSGWTFAWNRQ